MRRLLLVFLSLVLILGILAPAALAKDDGSAGGGGSGFGNGGGGGGGGYVRRESGLWVPEHTQRSAPKASPTVKELGKELAKDTAKGVVKDGVKTGLTVAGGAVAAGAASALKRVKDSPTFDFWRIYTVRLLIPHPFPIGHPQTIGGHWWE